MRVKAFEILQENHNNLLQLICLLPGNGILLYIIHAMVLI